MTRSVLLNKLLDRFPTYPKYLLDEMVASMIDQLRFEISSGSRIEIRGFGSFCLRNYDSRDGYNPKTGEKISISERSLVYFRPGKKLKERVDR